MLELEGGSFEAETDPNASDSDSVRTRIPFETAYTHSCLQDGEDNPFSEAEDDDDDDGEGDAESSRGSDGFRKKLARLEQEVYERGTIF